MSKRPRSESTRPPAHQLLLRHARSGSPFLLAADLDQLLEIDPVSDGAGAFELRGSREPAPDSGLVAEVRDGEHDPARVRLARLANVCLVTRGRTSGKERGLCGLLRDHIVVGQEGDPAFIEAVAIGGVVAEIAPISRGVQSPQSRAR